MYYNCKFVICNNVFCWFQFRVRFDCNFFQSFPCIFVGFNLRVVCESLVKNLGRNGFHNLIRDWLTTADSQNKPYKKHMLEFEESLKGWFSQVARDSGQVASDPQNALPVAFWVVTFLILYQHYINPYYPRNVKRRRSIFWRNFWERNPSQILES